MAKSRGRKFAEITSPTSGVFDLTSVPTITNAKLQNSAMTLAGSSVSLGGTGVANTDALSEGSSNLYFTDARVQTFLGGGTLAGNVVVPDNRSIYLGSDSDFRMVHNTNNTQLTNSTGALQITSNGGVTVTGATTFSADLTVDTSTLKVDSTNNRVGIGTASPATPLHTIGITTFDGDGASRAEITSSTASSVVSLDVGGFNGTPSVARDIRFLTNAAANAKTERMRISSAGHFIPASDSTYNIGANATRFANAYFDTVYGTLATAAQPNITSLGTLTGLSVGSTTVFNNSGVLQSAALSGTYSNAVNFSSSSLELSGHMFFNEFSSGRHYIHFKTAASTNQIDWRIQTNSANNTIHSWTNTLASFGTSMSVSGNLIATGTVMATLGAGIASQTNMQLALRDSDNTNMRANFMVEKAANSNRGGLAIQATESGVSNDRDIYLQPAGGRVGILTAAPSYGLDVNTTSRFVHNLTAEGNIIASDVKARTSGGLSLQTDEGTKRIFIKDDGSVGISAGGVIYASRFSVGKPPSRTPGSVFTSSPSSFFSEATLGGTTGDSQKIAIFGGEDSSNVSGLAIYRYRRATGTNWLTDGFSLRQEVDNSAGLYYYMNFAGGKVGIGDTAPFSKLQVGSNTFSGSNGMYADSRVGISNHGALTGLMLASTYNDSAHPEYGLVFIQGPSTSSYNAWSISPDGPAKGNRLNFHYGAQATNIHSPGYRMASLDGSGNFYPLGDVVMAQGKGIQFVNQADFATGETVKSSILDDYEEGTFVPTIGGSGTVGTWTPNSANGGFYIKVGRMVHLWINCTGSLSGASGSAYVYGLPFTTASNIADHGYNAVYSTGSLQYWSGAGYDVMGPLTYPGGRTLYFHTYNGYSNGGQPSVTNGNHNLHCCVSYYTS